MMIIGCDLHTRYQRIAMVDTETGEFVQRRLEHESGEARGFYGAPLLALSEKWPAGQLAVWNSALTRAGGSIFILRTSRSLTLTTAAASG